MLGGGSPEDLRNVWALSFSGCVFELLLSICIIDLCNVYSMFEAPRKAFGILLSFLPISMNLKSDSRVFLSKLLEREACKTL